METHITPIDVDNLEDTLKNSDTYVKDMLKFYQDGWDARGTDELEKLKARVRANVVTTMTYVSEVLQYFKDLNLKPQSAHIKLENPNSQSVLISVPLEDYLNRDLLKIYTKTHKIEQESRSDNYRVSFSISYDDGALNNDCLLSEGFVKTHTKRRVEKRSRHSQRVCVHVAA